MGVLNVTPDSFSDGGRYLDADAAVEHALRMAEEGADIIDVGGESTRPKGPAYGEGADPVSAGEELARIIPVIERFVRASPVPVSVDTMKAEVAREALKAGAVLVNDVSGFRADPLLPAAVAEAGAAAVVMHMKGTPKTTQSDTHYDDLFGEILGFLQDGLSTGERHGIERMIIDPGIGFGKTTKDNYRLIAGIGRFRKLGRPVLVGPSRKAFLGTVLNLPVGERLEGTLAAVAAAVLGGANIVRVHDVREVCRVVRVADEIRRSAEEEQAGE
jgi:dihydropteroate synthase